MQEIIDHSRLGLICDPERQIEDCKRVRITCAGEVTEISHYSCDVHPRWSIHSSLSVNSIPFCSNAKCSRKKFLRSLMLRYNLLLQLFVE